MHTCVCLSSHPCTYVQVLVFMEILENSNRQWGWWKLRWSDFFLGIKEFLNSWTHNSCDFIIESFTRFKISLSNMLWLCPLLSRVFPPPLKSCFHFSHMPVIPCYYIYFIFLTYYFVFPSLRLSMKSLICPWLLNTKVQYRVTFTEYLMNS